MHSYSPFAVSVHDLGTRDLAALRHVAEGWYVEYKRECPTPSALAKSVSAFANTYGGWLFLGIAEESKERPVAGAFPGIHLDEADATMQRLRQAAADHLNPTPYFESKILFGPNEDLGLASDRAVICVKVPQSTTAPHVHKSGKIYRRVSHASEPRPEADRFVLDQLWRRGDNIKRQHKDWFDRDPEFSDYEKTCPYVRLMLVADPWSQRDPWIEADDDKIRAALAENSGVSAIPFDTVYTYSDGLIGRQLNGNDPANMALTWRLRKSLVSDVIVPLPIYRMETLDRLPLDLIGYEHADRYLRILRKYQTSSLRIVDLNFLPNILIGVAEIQERLCKLASWTEGYYLKVKLLNSWRTTPFVDTAHVLQRFEAHGLPMCLDATSAFPRGTGPDSYMQVSRHAEIESDAARVLVQGMFMFSPLALSYGIPMWLDYDDEGKVTPYHVALQEAGRRAMEVQRLRNLRLKK